MCLYILSLCFVIHLLASKKLTNRNKNWLHYLKPLHDARAGCAASKSLNLYFQFFNSSTKKKKDRKTKETNEEVADNTKQCRKPSQNRTFRFETKI